MAREPVEPDAHVATERRSTSTDARFPTFLRVARITIGVTVTGPPIASYEFDAHFIFDSSNRERLALDDAKRSCAASLADGAL